MANFPRKKPGRKRRRIRILALRMCTYTVDTIDHLCAPVANWRIVKRMHRWASAQLKRRARKVAQSTIARWWWRTRRRHGRKRPEDSLMGVALIRPHLHFVCGDAVMRVNAHTLWRCLLLNGRFENPFTRTVVTRLDTLRWQRAVSNWETCLPDLTRAFDHRDELQAAFSILRLCCDETAFSIAHEMQRPLATAHDVVDRMITARIAGLLTLTPAAVLAMRTLARTLRQIYARCSRRTVIEATHTIVRLNGYCLCASMVNRPRALVVDAWKHISKTVYANLVEHTHISPGDRTIIHAKLTLCLWREWHPPLVGSVDALTM